MTESNKKRDSSGKSKAEKVTRTDDSKLAMVPFFSRRSIIILISGFMVGVLLAFGYWLISPLLMSNQTPETQANTNGLGLLGMLGIEPGEPFSSTVNIQVVNPGSTYMQLGLLQQLGEYYAAKASSLPFFQFLSEELNKYPLEVEYTLDDLGKIIRTEYDYNTELPTIKVTATATTREEAAFFASLIPQAFIDYLISEEQDKRDKEYEDTLEEIDIVKDAAYEAQLELIALGSSEVLDNPAYISLSSRAAALQLEFDNQVSLLALEYYNQTDLQDEYEKTLRDISAVVTELTSAELELLVASGLDTTNSADDVTLIILDSKIRGLTRQMDILVSGQATTRGLAQLIADGVTSGLEYDTIMIQIENTAEALAEAQGEYDELLSQSIEQPASLSLEYRLAQIKVDTLNTELAALQVRLAALYAQIINIEDDGESNESKFDTISLALSEAKKDLVDLENQLGYDHLATDMEYNIAEDKVANFNGRLDTLINQLGDLVGESVETSETGYLVAGNPSIPVSVLPPRAQARNTLIMGAILGIAVAWVVLNFTWLKRSMIPGGARPQDEED